MFIIDETLSEYTLDLMDRYCACFPPEKRFSTFGVVFKITEDEFSALMEEALRTGVPIDSDLLYDPLPPEAYDSMDRGTAAI